MPDAPEPTAISMPPTPLHGSGIEHWMLDPAEDFLNHGSFGARPRAVVDRQAALRAEFEASPIDWLDREGPSRLAELRAGVRLRIGARGGSFGFVSNASSAVNAVMRSLTFEPGDEILTTDHAYGAVLRTIEYVARSTGAVPVVVPIGLPLHGPGSVFDAVASRIGPRTRIVVVDHITSQTASVFPVERLVVAAREAGTLVLVDGAHAPGQIALDVEAVNAHWYTGNLHKWVSAPVGAAFLHASEDAPRVHPSIISHFHADPFEDEFAWQGTRDVTPWLTAPFAWDWIENLGGNRGWDAVREHNDGLAAWAGRLLHDRLEVDPVVPATMHRCMSVVPIPERLRRDCETSTALRDLLHSRYAVEVPVTEFGDHWLLRTSSHIYNRPEQYERLAAALLDV